MPVATPADRLPGRVGEHRDRRARERGRAKGDDRERALARALARDSRSRPIRSRAARESIRAASVSSSDSRPSSKVPTAHQTSPARGSIPA